MKKLFILLGLITLFAFTSLPPTVQLRYSFVVGDRYEWRTTTKQKILQSINGMNQEIESSMEGLINLKIVELTPTGGKVELEYGKLSSKTKTAMGEMNMDSDADTASVENKVIRAMTGKKFYAFMTKNGTIEKVEGVENLWSGFASLGLDEATAKIMKQSLEQMFGQDALKGNLEMAFAYYPSTKVKQGDTWKHITGMSTSFPLQIENTWSLTSLSQNAASLSASGSIITTDKEKIVELPGGIKTKFDLGGNQNTICTVDVKGGWPSEMKISSDIKGVMKLLAGGPLPTDMDIPMGIQTESNFVFTKK